MEVSTEKAVLNEGITFGEQLIEKFYWPVSLTVSVHHMFILFTGANTVNEPKSLFFCYSGCSL